MKLIVIGILFCCCMLVGWVISLKYQNRKKFFLALISFANKLSLEINFSRERLKILIENFDDSTKKHLLGIDKRFLDYLDRKCELTQECVFSNANILKADEKDAILLFLKMLGRSDVENQTKEIQTFVSRFEELKQQSILEYKKYGSLSFKLGIVAGLFVAVILF